MVQNNFNELPVGFGMALSQNTCAMEYFAALPRNRQHAILEQARHVSSSAEMHNFVNSLRQY